MIQNVFANFCLKYHATYFLYDQISFSRQTEEQSGICFIHARNSLRIYVQKNVYAYLPQVCPFVGVLGHDASAPLENPSISTHPSISCPSISDGHNQVAGEDRREKSYTSSKSYYVSIFGIKKLKVG